MSLVVLIRKAHLDYLFFQPAYWMTECFLCVVRNQSVIAEGSFKEFAIESRDKVPSVPYSFKNNSKATFYKIGNLAK